MVLHRAAAIALSVTGICFAGLSHASTAGSVAFATATHSEVQNNAARSLPVDRTGGSTGAAGAVCTAANGTAKSGTDFTMTSTSLQWANGDTTAKNCIVTILDGAPFSGAKTFTLQLTSVTGATVGAISKETVTIQGNKGGGSVTLSAAKYSVAQSAGSVTVTVDRTGGGAGAAVVFYSTANATALAGTNYTHASGMLSWGNGDSSAKTFAIPVSTAAFSGTKTFAVALASAENVVLGAQTSAIVTITGGTSSSGSGSAALSWAPPTTNTNGTAVTALAGYHIHYGTSQSAMNKAVAVSGSSTTSYELTGLTPATWFFAISADAQDGTSGPESSIGSKTIN